MQMQGTIRTGVGNFWGEINGGNENQFTAYAYVDTILMYNLGLVCDKTLEHHPQFPATDECASLADLLNSRRAVNPFKRWDDATYGRLSDWP